MLHRLTHACGFGVLAAALLVAAEPAFAQDTAGTVIALSVSDLVLSAIGTAALPLILAGWAWFKAHAAQSEAKWDNWMVAQVEQVARGVVEKSGSPVQPPAAAGPLDLRGRLGNGGAS